MNGFQFLGWLAWTLEVGRTCYLNGLSDGHDGVRFSDKDALSEGSEVASFVLRETFEPDYLLPDTHVVRAVMAELWGLS